MGYLSQKALITGITGQDGSYLAEHLLARGWNVHGIVRRSSSFNTGRVELLLSIPDFGWSFGDLSDSTSLRRIIEKCQPDVVFNLGAQSHVRVSFDIPEYTSDVGALGALRLLEAIRDVNPKIRYYQASSSEMFGGVNCPLGGYNEDSPFDPRSPYAASKVFAFNVTKNYREAYGMHASNGILFNHESPRRGETFVTRKITRGLARIVAGKASEVELGNLDAKRDWGHAADYVDAMRRMVEYPSPGDFVIATGETHSVREFLLEACRFVNLDPKKVVKFNPRLLRPTEVPVLLGDSSKARRLLGWKPRVSFLDLVRGMMKFDLQNEGEV